MNDLINLINDFINEKINLKDYLIKIKQYQINDISSFKLFLENYNDTNKMDQRMNALLILWFYKHDYFNNLEYDDNEYLSYIEEIQEDIDNYKLDYITIENNYLIIKLSNYYFIINHNNHLVKIPLPEELQYQAVYCLNCNDDMKLKDKISLPEFSFYVLEK